MTPELIEELISTAGNLATLLVMLPPADAAVTICNARGTLFSIMSEAFGADIATIVSTEFAKAVSGRWAELETEKHRGRLI